MSRTQTDGDGQQSKENRRKEGSIFKSSDVEILRSNEKKKGVDGRPWVLSCVSLLNVMSFSLVSRFVLDVGMSDFCVHGLLDVCGNVLCVCLVDVFGN